MPTRSALRLLTLATALTPVAVQGQTYTTTPRPEFATHEGGGASYMFGNWQTARYEFADGNHTAAAFRIKEIAYRHNYGRDPSVFGTGRSWSNVTLKISTCNFAKVDKVYYNNPTGAQTTVFNKGMTFPTQPKTPTQRPQPWTVRFPFTTIWSKPANADILLDYAFTGGRLANNGNWNRINLGYYLDSFNPQSGSCTAGPNYGTSGFQGGCRDSAATSTLGANTSLSVCSYSKSYPFPSYRDMIRVAATGGSFGKDSTVVTVLGFRGLRTGIAMPGVTCNRLHVDTSLPHFFASQRTSIYSGNLQPVHFGLPGGLTPYRAAYAGTDVIAQSAWNDTKTGQLKLSSAALRFVPLSPMFASATAVRLKSIWSTTIVVYSGVFGNGYSATTPLWRYGH